MAWRMLAPWMLLLLELLLLTAASVASKDIVFFDSFQETWKGRWIVTKNKDYKGKWKYEKSDALPDYGLMVSERAKKYGISIDLPTIVDPGSDTLVLQYDVRFQQGLECGGAYLKFLLPQGNGWRPIDFNEGSPYSIMFGPDKCGSTNKVHFIFRLKDPHSKRFVEHHLAHPPLPTIDLHTHVYTAIIYPNNTLKILVDGADAKVVDLLSDHDVVPPVVAPARIPDPDEKRPADWDDRETIPDPDATKPDDWAEEEPREIVDTDVKKPQGWLDDEPLEIDDPDQTKPQNWDEEHGGEWTPRKIDNPKCEDGGCGAWKPPLKMNPNYRGKWKAPLIKNPNYQGVWRAREIPNPAYVAVTKPHFELIGAIGIDLWTMDGGIMFDNILITHNESVARDVREKHWKPKFDAEVKQIAAENEEKQYHNILKAPSTIKGKIFEKFYKTIDWITQQVPSLETYKYKMITIVKKGEDHFGLALGIFGTIPLLIFSILYIISINKKKCGPCKVMVVKSKEEEKPTSGNKNTMGGSNGARLDATDGNVKSDHLDESVTENFESTTRLRQRREL